MVCSPTLRRSKIATQFRHAHKLIQSTRIIDVDGKGALEDLCIGRVVIQLDYLSKKSFQLPTPITLNDLPGAGRDAVGVMQYELRYFEPTCKLLTQSH